MKHLSKLIPALLLASSLSVAYAQTPGQRPMTPPSQVPQGGQMMGGGMPGMHKTMGKMQEQMAKIRSTSDPAERQKLMLEHMSTMREAMGTMMKTGGPGTGMMPGGGMMSNSPTAPAQSEMPGRMGTIEQRMGMMQMMMDQMMQHQDMMERRK
jgi:protein CpxP